MLRIRDVYPRSRILIFIHPGSRIPVIASRIQERKQKRRGEKICYPSRTGTFFSSHKYLKIENYSGKEKNLSKFSRNYSTFFPKKWSLSSQKYEFGIRDPGKPIPDPGSRIQKGRNTYFNNGIQYHAENTGKYIFPQNVGSSCWRSSLGSSWDRRHPLSTGEPTAAKNSEF
jgi:hypothetical protein